MKTAKTLSLVSLGCAKNAVDLQVMAGNMDLLHKNMKSPRFNPNMLDGENKLSLLMLVCAHGDADSVTRLIKAGANFSNMPIVQDMRESNDTNRQTSFTDTDGIEYYGAYSKLSIGDCGVVTTIQTSLVMQPVYDTLRRNIYLTVAVLMLAILFIYFFSKTISTPVKKLAAASDQIERGEYEVDLKPKGSDEIGLLTERFVSMGRGLAERERLKDSFGRFVNKEIAENMFISVNTVMTHRRNISKKLNIHSPAGLTIYAIVNGLVKLDEISL